MIGIYEETIKGIPSLVVVEAGRKDDALPLIAYFHGFTSAKEHNLPLAYLLAGKEFRVVLPDSQYHGEREGEESDMKKQVSFWDIVIQNIKELKDIKDQMESRNLIADSRIGVAGTSMGGITTSAALTQYPWISTAAVLMGSPKITTYAKTLVESFKKAGDLPITEEMIGSLYEQLGHYDLSEQPGKLDGRPLLFWHGDSDPVVPFDHSFTFYEQAEKEYTDKDKIRFIKEEGRGHKVSRHAVLETVKWFEKHL
ncbi:prolyl oligopeptidase family serine peptidase [Virgibacillus sediminis]|uniref:Prolyl oligopeptidase family serine peptidase n=1 Tax=Virgibacillus sediminis TaxID=202260 RepID=A0ABV7AB58_9BACI